MEALTVHLKGLAEIGRENALSTQQQILRKGNVQGTYFEDSQHTSC